MDGNRIRARSIGKCSNSAIHRIGSAGLKNSLGLTRTTIYRATSLLVPPMPIGSHSKSKHWSGERNGLLGLNQSMGGRLLDLFDRALYLIIPARLSYCSRLHELYPSS